MPYKRVGTCVHKINDDGSVGDVVENGCYDTEEQADDRAAAMNIATEDEVHADGQSPDDYIDDEVEVPGSTAMAFASLPDPVYTGEDEDGNEFVIDVNRITAATLGRRYVRTIKFSNLAITPEGRNGNGDFISADNLNELVATLSRMPLTSDHPDDLHHTKPDPVVFGTLTGGKVIAVSIGDSDRVERYALAEGEVWAGRNPDLVRAMITGETKPSIEGISSETSCSVCGQKFSRPADYCNHIAPITAGRVLPDGVQRNHYGMTSLGVAMVKNPAGANVGFRDPCFFLRAELFQEQEETDMEDSQDTGNAPEVQALNEQVATLTASVATLTGDLETASASLADANSKAEAAEARVTSITARVNALLDREVPAKAIASLLAKPDDFIGMPDTAFDLVVVTLSGGSDVSASSAQQPAAGDEGNSGGPPALADISIGTKKMGE